MTNRASTYVLVGEKLMQKIRKYFWTLCASYCSDLMLHDVGNLLVHANTIKKEVKKIIVFIYHHIWVLDLMRKYTK